MRLKGIIVAVLQPIDKSEISADEVVPLEAITTGVVGLRILFVNVFAVRGPVGWTLIDAGLAGAASRIERWARTHFGKKAKPISWKKVAACPAVSMRMP